MGRRRQNDAQRQRRNARRRFLYAEERAYAEEARRRRIERGTTPAGRQIARPKTRAEAEVAELLGGDEFSVEFGDPEVPGYPEGHRVEAPADLESVYFRLGQIAGLSEEGMPLEGMLPRDTLRWYIVQSNFPGIRKSKWQLWIA